MGQDLDFDTFLAPLTVHRDRPFRVVLYPQPLWGDDVPVLLVCYAGEGNDGFQRDNRRALEQAAGHPNTANKAMLVRQLLAPVFAKHVVVGWDGIHAKNAAGEMCAAEFTPDRCEAFLIAVANKSDCADVFDRLYSAATNVENFRDRLPSPVAVGKG